MTQRPYTITNKLTNDNLPVKVVASSRAQALAYITASMYQARAATTMEMIGARVEYASKSLQVLPDEPAHMIGDD